MLDVVHPRVVVAVEARPGAARRGRRLSLEGRAQPRVHLVMGVVEPDRDEVPGRSDLHVPDPADAHLQHLHRHRQPVVVQPRRHPPGVVRRFGRDVLGVPAVSVFVDGIGERSQPGVLRCRHRQARLAAEEREPPPVPRVGGHVAGRLGGDWRVERRDGQCGRQREPVTNVERAGEHRSVSDGDVRRSGDRAVPHDELPSVRHRSRHSRVERGTVRAWASGAAGGWALSPLRCSAECCA